MIDIASLSGIAFRAIARKDRLAAAWEKTRPYLDLIRGNKALWDEWMTLSDEILPGTAGPVGGYSIAWVQNSLNALGAHVEVDGKMGPTTVAAVKKFQQDNGLTVDGMPGIITCSFLNERVLSP